MKKRHTVLVCQGTGCISSLSNVVYDAFKDEVTRLDIASTKVDFTGCHGFCEQGPNVVIEPEGIFYTHVQADDVPEIVQSHLRDGVAVERLFYRDPATGEHIPRYSDINFYKKQQRVILHNCGHINPEKIAQYIKNGGFRALRKALLEMKPDMVIDEVKKAGLRGGRGFLLGESGNSAVVLKEIRSILSAMRTRVTQELLWIAPY